MFKHPGGGQRGGIARQRKYSNVNRLRQIMAGFMRMPMLVTERRAHIKATPAVFVAHLISLSRSIDPRFRDKFTYLEDYPPPSGLTIAIIDFDGGKLIANRLPDIGSALKIQIGNAFDTPDVVNEIVREISDLGWFLRLNNQLSDYENELRKPGRPRDPDNEWAREQFHILHRDKTSIYDEWLVRRKNREYWHKLVNAWDSFQKVLKTKPKK